MVDSVRKTPGVRKVDTEMARHQLLLVEIANTESMEAIVQLDGVEAVESMGTKSVF